MNVSITRIQRLIKNASIGLVTLLAVFFSTQVSAQTYVNADQAVQILKNEIESLQERGFNAYNNGSHQFVCDQCSGDFPSGRSFPAGKS